jgi:hypothetical protein
MPCGKEICTWHIADNIGARHQTHFNVRFTLVSGGKADIADWPFWAVRASVATA